MRPGLSGAGRQGDRIARSGRGQGQGERGLLHRFLPGVHRVVGPVGRGHRNAVRHTTARMINKACASASGFMRVSNFLARLSPGSHSARERGSRGCGRRIEGRRNPWSSLARAFTKPGPVDKRTCCRGSACGPRSMPPGGVRELAPSRGPRATGRGRMGSTCPGPAQRRFFSGATPCCDCSHRLCVSSSPARVPSAPRRLVAGGAGGGASTSDSRSSKRARARCGWRR